MTEPTEQSAEIVAAVDVSPVSPKPIHTSSTSPALVPNLQDHAATLDVAYLDSLTTAPFPFVTMPSAPSANAAPNAAAAGHLQSSPIEDTIVVRGDDDSGSSRDGDDGGDDGSDDESLDVYGEDDDGQQVADGHGHGAAGTGTSTGAETDTGAAEAEISEASSESMINTPSATSSAEPSLPMTNDSHAAVPSHPVESGAVAASANGAEDDPDASAQPRAETQTVVDAPAASDASAAASVVANPDEAKQEGVSGAIDIQKLVDSLAARAGAASSSAATAPQLPAEASVSSAKPAAASTSLPQSSSLPPKPAVPQQARKSGSRPEDFHPFTSRGAHTSHAPPPMPMQGVIHSHAAQNNSISNIPGAASNGVSSLPPIPPTSFNGGSEHYAPLPNAMSAPGAAGAAPHREGLQGAQLQQAWEAFQEDEKIYLTEANWGRYPDNSRIFIGNLSSERVSKREVFDVFHRFGRLAQISLKSAYGFVQYHSAEDAAAAMAAAQGAEMGGRQIHLEFSRTQKKTNPHDRDARERSPERRGQRGSNGPVRGGMDRYDGRDRDQGRRRDDYRPGRSPSPRRDDGYGRGGHDRHRGVQYDRSARARSRSRSPRSGRYSQDSYRRRSPSPGRRDAPEPRLDMPQRYGDQVPDVQLILLQEVPRDFVSWIQGAFYERGLKANDMYLNPRFSRDSVLQKLVVEGVHGVIELDARAPPTGRISLRVFHRSAGSNVRFDDYQDLEPKVAAELVLRAKQQNAAPPPVAQPAYPGYQANPYAHPQYHQAYPSSQVPVAGYPYAQPPQAAPQAPTAISAQDIAALAGKVDNNTLQALLASLPSSQQSPQPGAMPSTAAPGMAPQIDISALLGSLQGGSAAPHAQQQAPAYGYMPPHMGGTPVPSAAGQAQPGHPGTDTAAQVQNIMNSLAKRR